MILQKAEAEETSPIFKRAEGTICIYLAEKHITCFLQSSHSYLKPQTFFCLELISQVEGFLGKQI